MSLANAGRTSLSLRHLFAGLQSGVAGALAMLLFVMAGSAWNHRSVWLVPNLFATTFYGETAYRGGFVHFTAAGLALFFVLYGVLGMLWGSIVRDRKRTGLSVFGALYGIVWFLIFFDFLWNRWNPTIALYAPHGSLRLGHLIWGLILARSPVYAQRILGATDELPGSAAAEINSEEITR